MSIWRGRSSLSWPSGWLPATASALPFASVEEMRAAYDFADLQSFLDIYYAACA